MKADAIDANWLNHAIWYSATGYSRPYPGEDSVKLPSEVQIAAKATVEDDDAP
jgi:hypothetical protein